VDYIIEPQKGKKGRSFQASNVALVVADGLWESSGSTEIRPVWAMFCGSDNELRPFIMNLRLGRKAEPAKGGYRRSNAGERLEFLKSAGSYVSWQREAEGSFATIYHPELFRLDPGMVDPEGIKFVMLVPNHWVAKQEVDVESAVRHMKRFDQPLTDEGLADLVAVSCLFAAYIDRRTRCPLPADGRFYMQLLVAALQMHMASIADERMSYPERDRKFGYNPGHGFHAVGLKDAGIHTALSFRADHTDFEAFLAEQVALFFEVTEAKPKLVRKGLTFAA